MKTVLGIGLLALTYLAFGCNDQGLDASATGQVETMVTSSPISESPFASLTAQVLAGAEVTVARVFLVPAGGSTQEVQIFSSETGKTLDLMNLQNGLQASLAQTSVPAGKYEQVRVVLSEARVTLAEGYQFSDGSTTQILKAPSAEQSGLKVLLRNDVEVPEGTLMTLVLDLNIAQNFNVQIDAQSPNVVRRVVFTPVIREFRRDIGPAA